MYDLVQNEGEIEIVEDVLVKILKEPMTPKEKPFEIKSPPTQKRK